MNSRRMSCRILPALLASLLVLLPPARAAEPCLENLRLNPSAITQWSLEEKECGFRNLRTFWRHKTAKAAAPEKVLPLPAGKALDLPDADAFMQSNAVWGMLILHRGTVLLKKYRGAFSPEQQGLFLHGQVHHVHPGRHSPAGRGHQKPRCFRDRPATGNLPAAPTKV